jgi:proteic killer suppression protein
MIKSFKHKGLEKFFHTSLKKGIQPKHASKLRLQLAMLDAARTSDDMDKPNWGFHILKGDRADIFSVSVNGNWRMTFRFEDGDAHIVNYEDYH